MNSFLYLFLIIFSFSSFFPLGKKDKGYKIKTIVIDAGHGGKDPGCMGKFSKESIITLEVAKELQKTINELMPGIKVILTRQKDEFIELHDRANLANKNNADLFISIHCNSGPSHIKGTETYTLGLSNSESNMDVAKRENSVILKENNYKKNYKGFDPNSPQAHILFSLYQNAYRENSLNLATKVEKQFKERLGRSSRGVKQAGFIVLLKTEMPSILIEIGYLSNNQEEKYLNNKANRTYIASGIFRAFKQYKQEIE